MYLYLTLQLEKRVSFYTHSNHTHFTKMTTHTHYYNKFFLIAMFLFGITFSLSSQEVATSKNDSVFFTNIKKVYAKGISKDDFLQTCFIQWHPIKNDSAQWKPLELRIDEQIPYSYFEEIVRKLSTSSIVKAYTSSLKSEDGRPIYCLEIGNGARTVTFTAGVHAREVANPQFMLKFAANLVDEYEKGYVNIKEILTKNKVVILPCVNPDGYQAALEGNSIISNKKLYIAKCNNADVHQSKSNARGIDLNRNFPTYSAGFIWDDQTERTIFVKRNPYISFFSGDSLGSENETRVTMNFLMKYIPYSSKYIDFHSAGRIIYAGKPHLADTFNILCSKTGNQIKKYTRYRLLDIDDEETGNGTDGSITDFAAEVAAGFVYNEALGRLAPPDTAKLIKKTEMAKYLCSVNTVETLNSLYLEKKSKLLKPSTPQMHMDEWDNCNLYQLLVALISE